MCDNHAKFKLSQDLPRAVIFTKTGIDVYSWIEVTVIQSLKTDYHTAKKKSRFKFLAQTLSWSGKHSSSHKLILMSAKNYKHLSIC